MNPCPASPENTSAEVPEKLKSSGFYDILLKTGSVFERRSYENSCYNRQHPGPRT